MGNSLRLQPMPSRFGTLQTHVTEDVLQVGLLYAFAIIAASFIAIIPGIRGWERVWATIRVGVAIWVGAAILVSNFGSWYAASVCVTTQYKAHVDPINIPQLVQAEVAISIQLRGINITFLQSSNGCGSEDYIRPFPGEEINYLEVMNWAPSWQQGRVDFGEFGGQYQQNFRKYQKRGMVYPVQYVAETFLFDGDQYRWYRNFRIAGWYTMIFLWLAFATYLLSIMLFICNIRRGGYFMFLCGVMQLLAALTYGVVSQNDPPLRVYFADNVLRPTFNYAFYLTLFTGLLTVVLAGVVVVMDIFYPRKIATFFHHALTEDDVIFEGELEETEEEEEQLGREPSKSSYGRGSQAKIRRKGTINHVRGSVHSNRSLRGALTPRQKSQDVPEASASMQEPAPMREGGQEQLEMVTVH